MGVQRSKFSLSAGINRAGDPADAVVNSVDRELPKGGELLGAQILATADAIGGGATFRVEIQGRNSTTALYNPVPTGQSGVFGIGDLPRNQMAGGFDDLVPISQLLRLRLAIIITNGVPADFDNLNVALHAVTDYLTG